MFNSSTLLHTFQEKIRTVNFIQPLFFWTRNKNELISVVSALSRMDADTQSKKNTVTELNNELSGYRKDISLLRYRKAKKLNPPSGRRTKVIDNNQLQQDVNQLSLQIESSGVVTGDSREELNRVRLYKTD